MDAPARPAWDAARLQAALAARWPGLVVEVLEAVDSTNTRLVEQARHDQRCEPRLLVAEHQTAGRGRQGRSWLAEAGATLTFSLRLPLEPADWSGLSLGVGAALADALDPPGPAAPRVLLKWPNDLWVADGPASWRKLGGVLIETMVCGGRRCVVIGVGINVRGLDAPGLAQGSAGVAEWIPGATPATVLHRVALPLLEAAKAFAVDGFAPWRAAYARRDLLAGRVVSTSSAEVPVGIADGVEADGTLRVQVDGRVRHITGGEVSVRPQAGVRPASVPGRSPDQPSAPASPHAPARGQPQERA